jgi:acetolactate synthase-1/2/3 large subunit
VNVSEFIAGELIKAGVTHAFSLVGGLCMYLTAALDKFGIKQTFHHHEQCCAIAADAYARQSGMLGVAILTGGPGVTNAITGIVGAYQDSSSILILAGQC